MMVIRRSWLVARVAVLAALCSLLAAPTVLSAQATASTAQELMEQIKQRMQGARTYIADMKLKVDIPFLKAPPSEATLWYKAPNKTHIESPGFAMIPKQGADLSAATLLAAPYTAFDSGLESFHGTMMRKIRVIPLEDDAEIAVATIWVDTTQMVPRKVVSTAKRGGTFTAELVYANDEARQYCLPSYIKLFFDIGEFKLPKTMTGDFDEEEDGDRKAETGDQRATDNNKAIVQIWYKNYRINVPIKDSVFTGSE